MVSDHRQLMQTLTHLMDDKLEKNRILFQSLPVFLQRKGNAHNLSHCFDKNRNGILPGEFHITQHCETVC